MYFNSSYIRQSIHNNGKLAIKLLLLTTFFILLLSGCNQGEEFEEGKIKIVAVESFYGEVAQAIGNEYVSIQSLIKGQDIDPHEYEPTTQTAKIIQQAEVIIYNGLGYDDWVVKMIQTSDAKDKTVINVGTDLLNMQEGDNVHIWYDPATMSALADHLSQLLGSIDPEHASTYLQGAEQFKQSLLPLEELMTELKQPLPLPVAVSEPVFDLVLSKLNFSIINPKFAKSIEEETDPAPVEIANLQNEIRQKSIVFFVHNIQTHSPIIGNIVKLVEENNIPIIQVSETEPEGKTYVEWMQDHLLQIQKIISSTS